MAVRKSWGRGETEIEISRAGKSRRDCWGLDRFESPRTPRNRPFKPTPEQVRAATGKKVADVIAPGLRILFCGINPGLYSAAVGHHFARPGNRFWPVLFRAGLTDRLLQPCEERELLSRGCGITNIVARATASADDLSSRELRLGARSMADKVRRFHPRILAILGIGVYRVAFDRADAVLGRQREQIGETPLWVLPNPSGLNAHYQAADLAQIFRRLRRAVEKLD